MKKKVNELHSQIIGEITEEWSKTLAPVLVAKKETDASASKKQAQAMEQFQAMGLDVQKYESFQSILNTNNAKELKGIKQKYAGQESSLDRISLAKFARVWVMAVAVAVAVLAVSPEATAIPILDPTYTIVIRTGSSNDAHAGTWTVEVAYDSAKQVITFTVLDGPGTGSQDTWNGWKWTISSTSSGDVVTFDGTSARPIKKDGTEGLARDVLTFSGTSFNTKTLNLKIDEVTLLAGRAKYPIGDITLVPEPSSLALLVAGLFGLGWVRRRQLATHRQDDSPQ